MNENIIELRARTSNHVLIPYIYWSDAQPRNWLYLTNNHKFYSMMMGSWYIFAKELSQERWWEQNLYDYVLQVVIFAWLE